MSASYAIVMIVPAALCDDANLLGGGLGHGPETFGNPLYAGEALSHYGSHAWASQGFVDLLSAAGEGVLPQPYDERTWEDWGLSDARVWAVFGALTISIKLIDEMASRAHYDSVLESMELTEPVAEIE